MSVFVSVFVSVFPVRTCERPYLVHELAVQIVYFKGLLQGF